MSEFIKLELQEDRVCDAISKIGYSPAPALLDICDNSVTAKSDHIEIIFGKKDGKTLSNKNNVESYTIIDNGKGMDDEDILRALTIGSPVEYDENSLSKYGFGLKSAGLSLGNRIVVYSKKNNNLTSVYTLDRSRVSEDGFGVYKSSIHDMYPDLDTTHLDGFDSGTVIYITDTVPHHDSITKTKNKLEEQMGIVYYDFLKKGLSIKLSHANKFKIIEGVDILHWEDALPSFSSDEYCGTRPIRVIEDTIRLPELPEHFPPIKIRACVFPQDTMSSVNSISDEDKKRIKSYKVGRSRKGAFIYRNGRLISWGHSLDGIVGRDYLGLRVTIEVLTEHDEALHVDVSKQHFTLPESFLNAIQRQLELPKSTHNEVFTFCKSIIKNDQNSPEGSKFNERNDSFSEEDPDEELGQVDIEESKIRTKKIATNQANITNSSTNTDSETSTENVQDGVDDSNDIFERIRYSSDVKGGKFWDSGFDIDNGTFARVNKNHEFYHLILANLGSSSWERQSIEAIVYALSSAENITLRNLKIENVDGDSIDKEIEVIKIVLEKFKKTFSHQLESWSLSNQDILKDD
ncbi:ATP-binding protein [Photobacterium leiognathi]|uniref:ATP-binding protein n=1 Tax=Photobacterium leiognathi TaxID=553611 RepID=UPI002981FB3B|nr:ATP-binding protein [Photobacterium leiognathi]